MGQKNIITLTDLDEQVRYFTQESLIEQLAAANLPGTAPIKGAMRNLATAVKDMRDAQKMYFKSPYGAPEKQAALNASKAAENKVDKMIQAVNPILERL